MLRAIHFSDNGNGRQEFIAREWELEYKTIKSELVQEVEAAVNCFSNIHIVIPFFHHTHSYIVNRAQKSTLKVFLIKFFK